MTDRDVDDATEEVRAAAIAPGEVDSTTLGESWIARHRRTFIIGLLEFALLLLIVAVALVLRFWGIRWGTGYYLHPDELFMTMVLTNISAPSSFQEYLDTANSPLNPFNHGTGFIYGTVPLFLAKLVGSYTDYTAVNNAHIPGRWLSAIADTGTVVLVWWIGRMLWSRWVGLLAALLMAFTVLHIGASHYFTTDSWSAFFATASFAFVLAAWKYRRWVFYAMAGIMVGLAASSKPNLLAAFGFLILPGLETIRLFGWRGLLPRWSQLDDESDQQSFPVLFASILSVLVAIWTIRLAQPYTFEGPSLFSFRFDPRWLADVEYWRNAQSGQMDYYPGHQWTERAALIFPLKNMVLWGMGTGLGIAALAGLGWQLWKIVVARRWPSWITLGVIGWVCFHIVFFGISLVKTQRYLLPAYPFLVLLAAAALLATAQWAWRGDRIQRPGLNWMSRCPRWCHPGLIATVLVVGTTMVYGTAFVSLYSNPQTRVEASEWIVANVPDGSTLANEYWDLGLPVGIESLAGHYYDSVNLNMYGDENDAKLSELIGDLQRSEYIILSSNRLRDSIPRLPWRYPMATRYYEALYSGELGFEEVAHFTSYPELFGIEIDDRSAEEALTVYEHPEVTIFRKTERWNAHTAWYLLDDALGHGGLSIRPVQTQPQRMMLAAPDQEIVRSHASWDSIFNTESFTNKLPTIFWYIALQIVTLPMVPILWRVLPWLPDRGYAVAKTLGLFAVSWIAWWLGTVRWLDFGVVAIALSWLTVFAIGITLMRSGSPLSALERRSVWRWAIATEVIFLGGYLATVLARAQNPDLWVPGRIGTQIQNMATFNAMSLTPFFPAYDPWLVDGTIHDFTFGYMPWAVMTRITGIVPESAYSLALATMAALVIVNAWSAACLLIARFRQASGTWTIAIGGLLAPILLLGIGSLGISQRVGSSNWGPNFEGSIGNALQGLWTTISSSPEIPPGAWSLTDMFVGPGTLEFPLLSYLTGEMAIQQLGMPVFLAAVVLILGFFSRPHRQTGDDQSVMASLGGWRESAVFLLTAGLAMGWTFAANPLFGIVLAGLSAVLAVLAAGARLLWSSSWVILRDSGVALAIIGLVGGIAIAPFLSGYGYFATTRMPLLQSLTIGDYISHFGVLAVVAGSYLVWQAWSLGGFVRETNGLGLAGVIGGGVLLLIALGLAFLIGNLAILLILMLLLATFALWYRHDDIRHLILLGTILVVIGTSVASNRMVFATWTPQQNIPLQFSLVGWMLLAILGAPILVIGVSTAWDRTSALRSGSRRTIAVIWVAVIALLVGAGAVYPALGFPQRVDDRLVQTSQTLDASVFMDNGQLAINANNALVAPYDLASDFAAITWMRENLLGLPTIMEAPTAVPGWGGRISALTGFPTVIGLTSVQIQQRPGMERLVNWRYADVTDAYGSEKTFTQIEPILQDYGVQIIYVGALERATYSAVALSKFDQAVADGHLEVLYANDVATVYFYNETRNSQEPFDPE